MELTDLPEEIIIIIIRQLDSKSIYNMYNSCRNIRKIICMHGVVKKLQLSKNTMATAHSLKLDFFKDIAVHLQELNMCGIPDLKKTYLLPAVKKLKCLKTLDVSYTNINILDLLEVCQICPSIRNVTINFAFGKLGLTPITTATVMQCQNVFKEFENVNFIGSASNLLYGVLSLCILSKANLNTLKFTVAERDYVCTTNYLNLDLDDFYMIKFKQLHVYLLNWKETNVCYQSLSLIPVLSKLDLRMYEFIIIIMLNLNRYTVYVSPLFRSFFSEHFGVDAECITEFQKILFGNVSIMIWRKDSTNFDDNFFCDLFEQVKQYFPCFCPSDCETVSNKYDWFYVIPKVQNAEESGMKMYEPELRKRRIAAPSVTLNYDTLFREKQKLQLSIVYHDHLRNALTLQSNSDYLKKLTFLSLCGSVRYSSEFFNILFRCCNNLTTLNVEAPSISPCASPVSRSLPLTRCLKNFRLVDRRIDFKTLFSSLSQCVTLENIHLLEDSESEPCELADPSIILEKCDNLYNLFIEAPMSESARTKKLQVLNKARDRCKKYCLNIVLHAKSVNNRCRYFYDPFVDIFNLNPLKPI